MNTLTRIAALLGLALSTSACVTTEEASQNAVTEKPPVYASEPGAATSITPSAIQDAEFTAVNGAYTVKSVQVIVPDNLVVSEADTFKPIADIVWHGDPAGDRKAQVKTLVQSALTEGVAPLNGGTEAILAVQITRFHAQTPRTRATIGGKHEILFHYLLLDPETGKPLTEAKTVDATFKALGGRKAYRAERQGKTQKVRINEHLKEVIRAELSAT